MEKPISIIIQETKENLVDVINKSGLHPALLESIMKDLYFETQGLAKRQYEKDKEEYERNKDE